MFVIVCYGRRGGETASKLNFESTFIFHPWSGHCVVFLGKTLYSHSGSLNQMGTGELMPGVTLQWPSIPSRVRLLSQSSLFTFRPRGV